MQAGYAEYLAIRERLNLPLVKSSALVVAWSRGGAGEARRHRRQGPCQWRCRRAPRRTRDELRRCEPQLSPAALAAVLVPGEHIIDAWSAPLAYAHQALAHGAVILRNAEVTGGDFANGAWTLAQQGGPRHGARRHQRGGKLRRPGRGHRAALALHHHAAPRPVRGVRQAGREARRCHHPAGAHRAHQGCRAVPHRLRQPRHRPHGGGRDRARGGGHRHRDARTAEGPRPGDGARARQASASTPSMPGSGPPPSTRTM